MRSISPSTVLLSLALAVAPLAARAQTQAWSAPQPPLEVHAVSGLAAICPPQSAPQIELRAGERLKLRLDVYGAEMGTLELWLDPPAAEDRGKVALVAHARAQTSAFVTTNVGPYATYATSRIGPGLTAISAREEVDDSGTHWLTDLLFPASEGKLSAKMSKDGEPVAMALAASPGARDLLSTFMAIRTLPLAVGSQSCFEVYAGRHMWRLTGTVAAREPFEGPLGTRASVRIDFTSIRTDDPRISRTTRFWISDDARRLPLAAIAEVKGKTIRAQLESASGRGWSVSK